MLRITEISMPEERPAIVAASFIYVEDESAGHFSEWDGSGRFTWYPSLGHPPWERHNFVRHVRTFIVEVEIIYV